MTTTRLIALARQVADLAAAAPVRRVIPLPPAVAAYFDAHTAPRPVWDGYRLGRPLPPEGTALYEVHSACEEAASYDEPIDLLWLRRRLLAWAHNRVAWTTRTADWEDAARACFGVDAATVTRALWKDPAAMLAAWRRTPHDPATLQRMGFGPPELALFEVEGDA